MLPSSMTEVVEAYRNYRPPCDLQATVEELLGTVPAEHLAGLKRVVLTNAAALTGTRKRRWSWHRGRRVRHTDAAGLYRHGTHSEPAVIEVFVRRRPCRHACLGSSTAVRPHDSHR